MNRLILAHIAILLMFCQKQIHAQFSEKEDMKFRTYTTKDGLVYNDVVQCDEDSKGFLWLATNHGVSRFDGVNFKNFLHENDNPASVPDHYAYGVAVDVHDHIWFALKSAFCFYDQRLGSFKTITYNNNPIKCRMVVYYKNKDAMIGVSENGYYVVDCKTLFVRYFTYKKERLTDQGYMGTAMIDSRSRLWIPFTRMGYYTIDLLTDEQFYFKEAIWPISFFEDSEKNIWCATWQNFFRKIDVLNNQHRHSIYGDDFVKYAGGNWNYVSFSVTENKKLWGDSILLVATETDGLRLFNKKQAKFTQAVFYDPTLKDGVPVNNFNYVWTSKQGITWICSWNGLLKINNEEQQFKSRYFSYIDVLRSHGLIAGMADDPSDKNYGWLIINGSGVWKINKQTGNITERRFNYFNDADPGNFSGEDKNYNWRGVNNYVADKDKNVWVFSGGGLIKISKNRVDSIPLYNKDHQPASTYFASDLDSFLLVATSNGICKFAKSTGKYIFFQPQWPGNEKQPGVRAIRKIDENEFAICSLYGAAIFNRNTERFRYLNWNFPESDSADQHKSRSLEVIGSSLYFGTLGGLVKYDLNKNLPSLIGLTEGIDRVFENYLKKDKNDNLWIVTNHALYKYNPATTKIEKFTSGDGIYNFSHDLIAFFDYNDKFYLGYRAAYTSFEPTSVNQNSKRLSPILTDVIVEGKRQAFFDDGKTILSFDHDQNNFSFNFSAPDFTNADKITYAVMLEGLDKDWKRLLTAHSVAYNNLLPGNYKLKIKVANSSGIWGGPKTVCMFNIHPAWWQRWWFWPLLALIALALIIWAAYKRVRTISKREEQKTQIATQMAELEMRALRSQMNPHFIFNSLNSIQKYIWENKKEYASDYLAEFSRLIRLILDLSAYKTISLTKELELLRLYIALEHRRGNNKFNYHIFTDSSIQTDMIQIPPLLLQPFIENAIWHGLLPKNGQGNLDVSFALEDEWLNCIIDDDGIGRKRALEIKAGKTGVHKSVGLNITEERLKLMKYNERSASINIFDKVDEAGVPTGTKVTIKIPV